MKRMFLLIFFVILGCAFAACAEGVHQDVALPENMKSYKMGNFVYCAPEDWAVKDLGSTRQHIGDGGLLYSVSLMAAPEEKRGDKSAFEIDIEILERIPELVLNADIVPITMFGGHAGYFISGESAISEGILIEGALFINDPGYLQIVYSNPQPGDTQSEFEKLADMLYLKAVTE